MRTVVANAMLCLLVLLSVGTARCEVRCTAMSMPMSQAAQTATATGVEHCGSMALSHDDAAVPDTACSSSMCSHQALPASPDYSLDGTRHVLLQIAECRVYCVSMCLQTGRHPANAHQPPLQLRSPLDQSSTFRV